MYYKPSLYPPPYSFACGRPLAARSFSGTKPSSISRRIQRALRAEPASFLARASLSFFKSADTHLNMLNNSYDRIIFEHFPWGWALNDRRAPGYSFRSHAAA
jgi:hypothetical protein